MKAPLTTWDPFREFNDLQKRLSSLFFQTNSEDALTETGLAKADWAPAVDISEDDKAYTITADLPNVKKEDVKVTVEDGALVISGERHSESEKKDPKKKFHRIERSYGSYMRSFRLPEGVEPDKVDAEFKDGVLTVAIPKNEKALQKSKAKEIAIH